MHKKTHFHGHQNWPLKGLQGVSLCRQEFPDHMDDEHLVDGGGGGGGGGEWRSRILEPSVCVSRIFCEYM